MLAAQTIDAKAITSPRQAREKSRVRISPAERAYEAQLRKIATVVDRIVGTIQRGDWTAYSIQHLLSQYADAITPWATRTAQRMLGDVEKRSLLTWRSISSELSFGVKRELETAPMRFAMSRMMAEQIRLIKSIPLEAAERVHRLSLQSLVSSRRPLDLADDILRTGDVAKSRAILIARTEVSRAATAFVQSRAEHVGSVGYIWETARDGDVRPSHRKMYGKLVHWDAPPTLDGMTGHAGQFPNCRCWPRPVLPLE